jgi:hypothetical protein
MREALFRRVQSHRENGEGPNGPRKGLKGVANRQRVGSGLVVVGATGGEARLPNPG